MKKMKELLKKFDIVSIGMFALCLMMGVVDSNVLMAAPAGTPATPDGKGTPVAEKYTPAGGSVVGGAAGKVVNGAPLSPHNEPQGLDVQTIEDLSPEMLEETINPEIVKIRPCNTPLDTILRSAKSRKAEGFEFSWYSTDILPVSSKLVTISATSNNNRMGYKDATITVENPSLFNEYDTVCIRTADGEDYVFYVVSIDQTSGAITLNVGDADSANVATIIADIAADDVVYRLGRAHIDGEKQTVNYSALPSKESNYCQIFKWQVSATTLAELTKKEVKWSLSDMEEQAMIEFKIAQEASNLFGKKTKYYNNAKGSFAYATGGIVNYISKYFEFDVANGDAEVVDLTKYVFQGNVGNRKRVMFMGSEFNAALSKMGNVQKQLAANETKVVKGMEFNELRTNFGTLMCMQHDLFDLYGYSDKAIILDIDNIDKWTWLSKLETITDDPHFDGTSKIYTEIAGVSVRYPDTHCIVGLKPATSAGPGTGA